jgi:hypothetical protein
MLLATTAAEASAPERAFARLEFHSTEATASCIEKRDLERAVERRLRRKVFQEPAGLVFDVRLARVENGWSAELVLFDEARRELGRRALDTTAKDCSALDASLALVVALLADSPPEPPPPVEPAPAAPPVTPPTPPKPPPTRIELPKDTHAPRQPWHYVATITFAAAFDRLPGLAFGPRAGVAFLPPAFPEFRLSAGALLPREETTESGEFGGRFWLLDVALELCPIVHRSSSLRLSGCVGQSVGRLSVTGFGFDENEEEAGLDLVVTAGVSSFFTIVRPLGVVLGLGAGLPLSRNAYSATTAEGERVKVWQRGYVVGSGEVGIGLEL